MMHQLQGRARRWRPYEADRLGIGTTITAA